MREVPEALGYTAVILLFTSLVIAFVLDNSRRRSSDIVRILAWVVFALSVILGIAAVWLEVIVDG